MPSCIHYVFVPLDLFSFFLPFLPAFGLNIFKDTILCPLLVFQLCLFSFLSSLNWLLFSLQYSFFTDHYLYLYLYLYTVIYIYTVYKYTCKSILPFFSGIKPQEKVIYIYLHIYFFWNSPFFV